MKSWARHEWESGRKKLSVILKVKRKNRMKKLKGREKKGTVHKTLRFLSARKRKRKKSERVICVGRVVCRGKRGKGGKSQGGGARALGGGEGSAEWVLIWHSKKVNNTRTHI